MLCPRCRRENRATSEFCVTCGAPLALREEPAPRPLDVTVSLDRRGPGRSAERTGTRAGWELDLVAAATAEPTFTPVPASPRAAEPAWSGKPPGERENATEPTLGAPVAAPVPDFEVDVAVDDAVVLRRAPSWRRALSWGIDLLPFAALSGWLMREATGPSDRAALRTLDGALDVFARNVGVVLPFLGFLAVAGVVYLALAYALMGASIGKWITGIRVVGPDGRRPSPRRAFARAILAVLSLTLLGLGVLLALFTRSGRALHDFLAGTWVVEKPKS